MATFFMSSNPKFLVISVLDDALYTLTKPIFSRVPSAKVTACLSISPLPPVTELPAPEYIIAYPGLGDA